MSAHVIDLDAVSNHDVEMVRVRPNTHLELPPLRRAIAHAPSAASIVDIDAVSNREVEIVAIPAFQSNLPLVGGGGVIPNASGSGPGSDPSAGALVERWEAEELAGYQARAEHDAHTKRSKVASPRTTRVASPTFAPKAVRPVPGWTPVAGLRALDGLETCALLLAAIGRAEARVFVTQFLVDARPSADRLREVRALLHALLAARGRGVDVRVLVPIVFPNEGGEYDMNTAAVLYLRARGIDVRQYAPTSARPRLHAKVACIDDLLVVGNGNFTARAFHTNAEAAAVVRARSVSDTWAGRFLELFNRAGRRATAGPPGAAAPTPAPGGRIEQLRSRGEALLDAMDDGYGNATANLFAGQPYVRAVAGEIEAAKERVWLCVFGLRATKARRLSPLLDALGAAARRGIDVRVLVDPDPKVSDIAAADAPRLGALDVPVRFWPLRSRLHARLVIVDATAFVGSIGWTPASIFLTEELVLGVRDRAVTDAFASQFETWWTMAGVPALSWPIEVAGWPARTIEALHLGGLSTLGDVVSFQGEVGGTGFRTEDLRKCAQAIAMRRTPPGLAGLALGTISGRSW